MSEIFRPNPEGEKNPERINIEGFKEAFEETVFTAGYEVRVDLDEILSVVGDKRLYQDLPLEEKNLVVDLLNEELGLSTKEEKTPIKNYSFYEPKGQGHGKTLV